MAERTSNSVQTGTLGDEEGEPHGFSVCFHHYNDQAEAWTQDVCDVGIDTIEGPSGGRKFTYYFDPLSPLGLAFADGTGPKKIRSGTQGEVLVAAAKLTVELMARATSEGSRIGSAQDVKDALRAEKARKAKVADDARKQRAKDQRAGCLVVVLGFLGFCILLGLLNG